jgi:hypothetical protein
MLGSVYRTGYRFWYLYRNCNPSVGFLRLEVLRLLLLGMERWVLGNYRYVVDLFVCLLYLPLYFGWARLTPRLVIANSVDSWLLRSYDSVSILEIL